MNRRRSAARPALLALALAFSACGVLKPPVGPGPTPTPTPNPAPNPNPAPTPPPPATDWRDQVIYFALTDRFNDGDPTNDNGANLKPGDAADKTNPLGWHGGDFKGITAKINEGYFGALGVTAIWVSPVVVQVPAIPVNDGPNKGQLFAGYHGYWAEDFRGVDPHFGSLADFKTLIDTAHRNNIKIIQDIVVNHAGYGATLTKDHPDWFHTDAQCQASSNQRTDCPLAGLPDFNQQIPEVTLFLNDFVRYWRANTAIDGLRIDTMQHVPDSYWQQFFASGGAGDASKIWSVGEVFNGDPNFLANYLRLGSPSVFDFPLYFAVKDNLSSAGGDLGKLGDVFAQDSAYPDASRLTTFVDNHDVTRFISEVENRGGSVQQAQERLDLALSLIYTVRGTPSVYQGTENAMPGKGDPYNYPLGQGNREDMNFSAPAPLRDRLAALAQARSQYPVLRRGTQQELWRPNGGPALYAYRRVASAASGGDPVVVVLNGSDADIKLSDLAGGGIPLLGTFSGAIKEITGRTSDLSVQGGQLVGTVPARSALIVSGVAGSGGGGVVVNPALPEVTGLNARAGDGAAGLSWTPVTDAAVSGYRVYVQPNGGQETQVNFAPIARTQGSYVVRGLTNGMAYSFRVVTVDASGAESKGVTASATPSNTATVPVTFTVDARSQGNGPIELRRFDTGSQVVYPMTSDGKGTWKTTVDLPLFRDIKFKFGNTGNGAKNTGYEGPNQPDRSLNTGATTDYSATYDFINVPVPGATVEGTVTGAGTALSGALVEAGGTGLDPNLSYALTDASGHYTLFAPAGNLSLTARAQGFTDGTQSATAPATGVNFSLTRAAANTKYAIDGDLSDWTSGVTLTSPQAGGFGANNNWLSLRADADANYLYLGYTYTVDGNSAILYLDVKDGGATKADGFDAWKRAATFTASQPDFFLARYNNQTPELRQVNSDTATAVVNAASYLQASSGTLPNQTVEVAIPWSALGLTGKPASGVKLYGGIFGGDGYGAGDAVPNADSTPSGNNPVDQADSFRVTFNAPLTLP